MDDEKEVNNIFLKIFCYPIHGSKINKKEGKKAYNVNNPWKTVDRESNLLYLIIYTKATVSSYQKYFTHYSAEKEKKKEKENTSLIYGTSKDYIHTHKVFTLHSFYN